MREIVDGYLVNDDNVKIAFTNRILMRRIVRT